MQIGVIGCGRIAQIMHLPHLEELPQAAIGAIADPVESVRSAIGDRYSVSHRYADSRRLIEEADHLDGVIIATPPQTHPHLGVAALDAGLHTFIEKPLALSVAGADRLVDAAERADKTAMVGYMKRHDPTYLLMQDRVASLEAINRVVSTLVLGQHDALLDDIYDLVTGDLPEDVLEASQAAWSDQIEKAIGTREPAIQQFYSSHLGASCHDISALRGLFGAIEEIEYVDLYNDNRVLLSVFEFEDRHKCVFTSSFNDRKQWEEFIRVETPTETVTLEFTNPYLKNHPFTITTISGQDQLNSQSVSASYAESFKAEMEHFLRCSRENGPVRTTVQEGRDDVAVFVELFTTYLDARG